MIHVRLCSLVSSDAWHASEHWALLESIHAIIDEMHTNNLLNRVGKTMLKMQISEGEDPTKVSVEYHGENISAYTAAQAISCQHLLEQISAAASLFEDEDALTKNLQTMKDMRILQPQSKNGIYKSLHHTVDNKKIVWVLVATILKCAGKEYMTWEEIIHHPALFPFIIEYVAQSDLAACDRFKLERMGDDIVIRLRY